MRRSSNRHSLKPTLTGRPTQIAIDTTSGYLLDSANYRDLLILNALTIVTEFIGVALALGFLGCPKFVAIPAAAVLLFAVVAGGSFRRWEALMFLLIAVNVLVIPMVLLVHPSVKGTASGLLPPACISGVSALVP